jgi:putative Holliday junction resolvase
VGRVPARHDRALAHDLEEIARRAAKEAAGGIVVGLPLNADGTRGPAAEAAAAFAKALAGHTPLPVTLWDEFLTTAEAEEALIAADVSRAKRRRIIDQVAAVHLLESFLRARREGERGKA